MNTSLLNMADIVVVGIALGPRVSEVIAARRRSVGRRMVDVYKNSALLVLNVLVCFACLELASRGMLKFRSALAAHTEDQAVDARSASSYYVSQSWAVKYWREFK